MADTTKATGSAVPQTMRAWQYSSTTGGLEKNMALQTSVPVPALSGNRDMLVRVLAASLNPADYKFPEQLGLASRLMRGSTATPAMDFAGRVAATAPGVDGFAVGDLVLGRLTALHGALAEYATVRPGTDYVAAVPAGVDAPQAAAVGTAAITAYQTIAPNVKAGDKVFLNGGAGGTGTYGIQIAKALGCSVTTTCSGAKAELCKSLGADNIIDYTKVNVAEKLASEGPVYALAVDNVGMPEDLYKKADGYLTPDAKFVQIGGGMHWNEIKALTSRMLMPSFLGGGKRKFEFLMVKTSRDQDLQQLVKWLGEGKVRSVVDQVFEFEDAPKAFEKLKTGRAAGKIVVRVGKE